VEGAGRRPAGLDVGIVEGIEHGPEDIALGAESGVRCVLFFAGAGVLDDPGQSEVGVLGSLREAAGEVVESGTEPGIVFAQSFHAKRDQLLGEEFGQGRSDGLEMRAS